MRGINVQALAGNAVDPALMNPAAPEYQSMKIGLVGHGQFEITIKRGCRNRLPFGVRGVGHS